MAAPPLVSRSATAAPPVLDGLWRACELGRRAQAAVVATGHAALDAVLPGGGWPVGALTELLVPAHARHEWDLLAPVLSRLPADQTVVLVGAPQPGCAPFGPALAGRNLAPGRLLWVQADAAQGLAWATGQALRCRDVAAVLAWLPQVRSARLRQLQVAAQSHGKLLFVVRDRVHARQASPAPLRLWLQGESWRDAVEVGLPPVLAVHVVKRQGPPLAGPVRLTPGPARLQDQLRASRGERLRRRQDTTGLPLQAQPGPVPTHPVTPPFTGSDHALDRAAAAG